MQWVDTGTCIEIAMAVTHPDGRRFTCADLDEFNDALIAWIEALGMAIGGTLTLRDDDEDALDGKEEAQCL